MANSSICDVNNHTRKAKGNIREVNNEEESAEKTIEKTKENEINNNLCDISRPNSSSCTEMILL